MNDLLDVASDRKHPDKRNRPFASGALQITSGIWMICLSFVIGVTTAYMVLPAAFVLFLLLYYCLTLSYTIYFKRKLFLDVLLLAALYTLRVIAGGSAVNVLLSQWLLAFSIFFFLSLGFAKRYDELALLSQTEDKALKERNYRLEDLGLILSVGPASGYIAILVFCLYIESPKVTELYNHAIFLWLIIPVMLYWINRIWFLAARRELGSDPVAFAIKDGVSILSGIVVIILLICATL